VKMNSRFGGRVFMLTLCCASAFAAPMLRLTTSTVYVAQLVGATAPSQTVYAYNAGNGSLNLNLSVSPLTPWLTASVGAASAQPCSSSATPCFPLQFAFTTSSLPLGIYTAEVTVSDPNAIDAPQVVTVTVQVTASTTPIAPISVSLAPGASLNVPFSPYSDVCVFRPACFVSYGVTTTDGGRWLSVGEIPESTLPYDANYFVDFTPAANMAPGTYAGAVALSGSAGTETIPVTMQVTTQPIAVPSVTQVSVSLAQGGPALTYPFQPYISLSNSGIGTLVVQNVTASGMGVSAYNYNGLAIVTLDPGSLGVGTYTGAVTFQCNAVNCPLQIPVSLQIVSQGPPLLYYQGASDNVSPSGISVAQGDVMVVKGAQLSVDPPAIASGLPLPNALGGASVLVNGVATPLYYSSSGQIAFQMPIATPPGTALVQVNQNGQKSNTISVTVAKSVPEIVVVTDVSYNVIDLTHPATVGETLILWAIGLGPTNPPIPDGVAAPANPPATAAVIPSVFGFGSSQLTPSFAGLSPGEAGLYQVIVTVPPMAPGTVYIGLSEPGLGFYDTIRIAVQ
jgi:uncharacterized protein (TIGR03437 family)